MFWLGIDGGGTKTACTLLDDGLNRLDKASFPTCHYAQAGFDGAEEVLVSCVRWGRERIERMTGRPCMAHDVGIGFGICGYGEVAEANRRLEQIAARICGGAPYVLANDVESAWAGSLGLADGVVIIAGTGSIAMGSCGGRQMRCGGWDYELGDEGSAGWLGKEALRIFTRQSDGREKRGELHRLIRERLALDDDFDVISFAQKHYAERSSVAALAPLVTLAAQAGDASARGIFERAADEMAEMVRTIVAGVFAKDGVDSGAGKIPVSYVGGVFNAGQLILGPLSHALPACCRIVDPQRGPDVGAVLLLQRSLGRA